jgi:hypothetical protein
MNTLKLGLISLAWIAIAGACAADPCDEVEDRCNQCNSVGMSLSCGVAAAADDSDSCQALLDDAGFTSSCPL